MPTASAMVGTLAPDFELACVEGNGTDTRHVKLADFRGRWLILMFYPRDFSLVCPTELTGIGARIEEFRRRGCNVLGVSTDSVQSHQQWLETPRALGGLAGLELPLASDPQGSVSRAYGVYLQHQHVALRGLFIVDPNGVLQYAGVHNLSVGRRSEEVLRILAALQTGGMCPEDWALDDQTLDPTTTLGPGSIISHYRIEQEVGHGSFACVFRAHDTMLQRTVALKVFKPAALPRPMAALAEARAAAALSHPNVCTIFAADDSEGLPIIVMEYLGGRPLSAVLRDGALEPDRAAQIGRQIAEGVSEAHRHGIIHGDLKPANIMLAESGTAKIMDFGLARHATRPADGDETRYLGAADEGEIAGTPNYMAPEQTAGEAPCTASDVFSFGLVFYEMLSGRKAFSGDNVLQLFQRIRDSKPEHFAGAVPEPFRDLLRAALVGRREERRITMAQIAASLAVSLSRTSRP